MDKMDKIGQDAQVRDCNILQIRVREVWTQTFLSTDRIKFLYSKSGFVQECTSKFLYRMTQFIHRIKSSCPSRLNELGKSSQLEKHGFGSLHSLTRTCYNNEDILLRH